MPNKPSMLNAAREQSQATGGPTIEGKQALQLPTVVETAREPEGGGARLPEIDATRVRQVGGFAVESKPAEGEQTSVLSTTIPRTLHTALKMRAVQMSMPLQELVRYGLERLLNELETAAPRC